MLSSTVENYLKAIFLFSQKKAIKTMPMGEVANALKVTPGTATTMIKSLEEADLAIYKPRIGVELTTKGIQKATHVVRRHRLIEYFLVDTLGMDWSEVHVEAEILEHSISERVLDKIDEHLNFPSRDPHGDPIPSKEGIIVNDTIQPLDQSTVGDKYKIVRITDQSTDFLNFISENNLIPDTIIRVELSDQAGDILKVKIDGKKETVLSGRAASKLLALKL